ncbi:MAG: heparinase II/III family protein [Victivallales bacterium]|nr:heparinase II/III family protein [Victivallales bacterium]
MNAVDLTTDEQQLLQKSIPEYLSTIYPPEIPRAFDVHRLGCPVCGEGIKKHGSYSWIMDPAKPFKLQCPECKSVFPDNDFEAYWKSGFKDKSLLTGKVVDDGRGWRPKPGEPKYWFVAYYAHWVFSKDRSYELNSIAYQRTGEAAFARRTLAILYKYAERYPDFNYNTQSRYAEEINRSYNGRILNAIWETGLSRRLAEAYYRVMPYLETPDPELEQILGKSMAQIKQTIEENMLRVMASDIMNENGKNRGNYGMHQTALLAIAKCLGDETMKNWVTDFSTTGHSCSAPLNYALTTNIFGDGAPMESPGYNCGWLNNIGNILISLMENDIDTLSQFPSAKRLYTYSAKMVLCGRFSVSSGDTGSMQNTGIYCANSNVQRFAFEHDPTPQAASLLLCREKSAKDAKNLADTNFGYESNLLSAYGMANLQNGNREHPTAVVLAFPAYLGHRHSDSLDLQFFAENVPLVPDFGYPESASGDDPTRGPFYANTVAHNTVVVNAHRQEGHPGRLLEYDRGPVIQRMVADCTGVYEEASLYRRSVMVAEAAPGKTIVFDVFRVKGGHQHDWFMHSCGNKFQWEQKVTKQHTGTLAGEDVPYGMFFDSPKHEAMKTKSSRDYAGYRGSGYQFLTDVSKGEALPGTPIVFQAASNSRFKSNPGAALKIYPLDKDETIFFSHGMPPRTQRNPQKHVVFMTRRRTAKDENLQSMFSTVWESTSDEIAHYDIERVEPISTQANVAAAKITFKDGRLLYFFDAEENITFSYDGIEFGGKAGALLVSDRVFAYIAGSGSIVYRGRRLEQPDKGFSAKVAEVDLFKETITLDREAPSELAGRMFRVGNYAYIADKIEGRVVKLRDQSTIRGRFRLFAYSKGKDNEGASQPNIVLAKSGMSIYSETGEFVSRLERDKSTVKSEKPLELNKDYWVSECGPGDEVLFPSAFSVDLPAD